MFCIFSSYISIGRVCHVQKVFLLDGKIHVFFYWCPKPVNPSKFCTLVDVYFIHTLSASYCIMGYMCLNKPNKVII